MAHSAREPSARRVHRLPGGVRMAVEHAARMTCTVNSHISHNFNLPSMSQKSFGLKVKN